MASSSSKPGGQSSTTKAPSGGKKTLYDFLGEGKVADVVLWRNKRLSAGILAGFTVLWLLFDVAEYHFVTLLCQMAIAAILVVFIWSNVAVLFGLSPPKIPEVRILSEQAFKEFVETLHRQLISRFVSILHRIAFGEDLKLLLFAILSLWILSVIGSWCSSLSLLYFVFLCIQTLPALYKRYEREVDDLAAKGIHELDKLYAKLEQEALKKVPRGPGKQEKKDK